MKLSKNYGDADPEASNIILVSAPGAVGKTTLARQIAAITGAIFVDLAKAEPVGANTLIGGLARSKTYDSFENGEAGILVDGLDEARMRVTQEGMAAFMRDIVTLAADDRNPIVLLGRTGAVQEAWLWLLDEGVEAPVLEIGYYDVEQAAEFVKTQIQSIRKEEERREPDGRAVDLMLERLRNETLRDGGAFSGYSPVLVALSKRVAAPGEDSSGNTQQLISRIEKGEEVFTLEGIANAIMSREKSKLSTIQFDDHTLAETLYSPDEQLARLVSRIYGGEPGLKLPAMSAEDQERYNNALASWLAEHPFLDGEGRHPSSAVFGGLLAAHALNSTATERAALAAELGRGTAVNPFLSEFYIPLLSEGKEAPRVPSEHLGILYASVRARLAIGEYAGLIVDGDVDEDDGDPAQAEIEIIRGGPATDLMPLRFEIDPEGVIAFGPQIEDVDISAPLATISIGYGAEAIFVSPVFIETGSLIVETSRVVAEDSPHATSSVPDQINSVQLYAHEADVSGVSTRPIRRGDVSFEVSWPGAQAFPWTDYAVSRPDDYDELTEEAIRRMKKILRLFRSHSRNQLAKFRAAVDHRRRTKGVGGLVLAQLKREGVLTVNEPMYFLDPERLAEVTGLNFHDVRSTTVHQATIDFVQRALQAE